MYKCAKCLEPIRANINTVGIQCERCGSKMNSYLRWADVAARVRREVTS